MNISPYSVQLPSLQGDAAFFRLTATNNPRPSDAIFGLSPSFGTGTVSVTMTILQPNYLGFTSPANNKYTVTVCEQDLQL